MEKDYRSAETGRYVTAKFAKTHPNTTVSEFRKPLRKRNSDNGRNVFVVGEDIPKTERKRR